MAAAKKKVAKKRTVTKTKMTSELQAHVDAEGRDQLVKQVRRKIKELGISYIY